MDFRNANLDDVFRMLATVGGMNIVLAPGVSGTITLRLKGVDWDLALNTICRAHGLEAVTDQNVVLIRPRQSL